MDSKKQARTVDVEARFTHPGDIRDLLAGYSADIEIILEKRADTIRIPTESILDGTRVFVFLPDRHEISQKEIRIGISNWDYTEIVSGLSVGGRVVLNVDQAGVKDGAKAKISSAPK